MHHTCTYSTCTHIHNMCICTHVYVCTLSVHFLCLLYYICTYIRSFICTFTDALTCMIMTMYLCAFLSDEEPLLDNTTVQAAKVQSYFKHIGDVRHYYESTHRNWYIVNGEMSRWKVWDSVLLRISPLLDGIQQYIDRIPQGLYWFCVIHPV